MNTLEAMRGYESQIISAYKLPPITGNRHYSGECPVCRKKNKFRLHEYNGAIRYICVCGAGNLIELIIQATGLDFQTVAAQIDKITGRTFDGEKPEKPKCSFTDRFKTYQQLRGTQAEAYLHNRGIYDFPKKAVRYSDYLNDSQGMLKGIVSVATDNYGRPCYEHRTYLHDGKKAEIATNKKMRAINKAEAVAVRMFDPATCLGMGEGIETALSAHQLYSMPCWSTLNSGFMKKFIAPRGVRNLYLFADNDANGTGLAAAFECGNRNILSKNDVKNVIIRWPEQRGDFNDVLVSGISVIEWRLNG